MPNFVENVLRAYMRVSVSEFCDYVTMEVNATQLAERIIDNLDLIDRYKDLAYDLAVDEAEIYEIMITMELGENDEIPF